MDEASETSVNDDDDDDDDGDDDDDDDDDDDGDTESSDPSGGTTASNTATSSADTTATTLPESSTSGAMTTSTEVSSSTDGTGSTATDTSTSDTAEDTSDSGGDTEFAPGSDLPVPPLPDGQPRPEGALGNLVVVPWAGFTGAVSYTFDDANSSQINNYDALAALEVPFTFYLQTGKSEAGNAIWGQAVQDGHELGNHTRSHMSSGPGIGEDTDSATMFIESNFGVEIYTMAAPNGSGEYASIAATRFLINRGVSNGIITPSGNTDPFNLPAWIPSQGAPASAFNAEVDATRSAGGWKVVCLHGFTGGSDGAYQPVSLTEFTSSVTYAKDLGDMWLGTVADIGAYWLAHRMMASVSPVTAGESLTYSWDLPDHFPTQQFLRVTLDGGRPTQSGLPLRWDPHGYYEVSLDEGSLTVEPL